jgi:hypothetical protein
MPVTDFSSDWNAPYRMPQGWTTLPDGTVGPSSAIPDWLKQLIPQGGGGAGGLPMGPGGPPGGGAALPGAGVPGMPGAPGAPAQAGPQIFPPQNSAIPPNKSVGPFTGGSSTENGSAWDPRSWFRANPGATFQQGQPMNGPGGPAAGAGGASSLLSMFGGGNPYARAAIAAGGVMSPTPADTGELPLSMSGARPQHPSSQGAMPGFQGPPSRPYTPTPQYAPAIPPTRPDDPETPQGSPSATPPVGGTPYPPKRPKNLGGQPTTAAVPSSSNPRFGTVQYGVGGGRGPLSSNPIYTTLNLANLFGGKSS